MKDDQLLRYSRHILLPQLDIEGQQAIMSAHVMIIGLGGLGSPVALYLAAAGVGEFTLVDDDSVELTNLQRQIAHNTHSLDLSKVESAKTSMLAMNPEVTVHCHPVRADNEWLCQHLNGVTLMVDCSDNADIRYAMNDAALAKNIPWVSGAAVGFAGQVAVFDPREDNSPCYRCLYPALSDDVLSCAESGVLSPVVGVIGSLQSTEALRLITKFGEKQHGCLHTWDALSGDWRRWKLSQRENCVCVYSSPNKEQSIKSHKQ
jgi:molybdopterin/thiamine biosynthesis adenylyltransferase